MTAGFDEQAWEAVIGGRGASFYLPRFRAIAAGERTVGWHWPAFFATSLWLARRRMPGAALLNGVLFLVAAGVLEALARDEAFLPALGGALLALLVPPLFATRWYYGRCLRIMRKARAATQGPEEYLGYLRARGGTRTAPLVVIVLLAGFALLPAAMVTSDGAQRLQVAAAARTGRATARAVVEQFRRTGRIPASLEEVPDVPVAAQNVRVRWDGVTGYVVVKVQGTAWGTLGTLRIRPWVDQGKFRYHCSSPDIDADLLPAGCQPSRGP